MLLRSKTHTPHLLIYSFSYLQTMMHLAFIIFQHTPNPLNYLDEYHCPAQIFTNNDHKFWELINSKLGLGIIESVDNVFKKIEWVQEH